MVIEIRNLLKRYKELVALDNFNLSVEKGEIHGLVGPNGSGKTTAINCILSLLQYEKGSIYVFGESMAPTKFDIKKHIGYIPQEVTVIEDINVQNNVDFFCGLYIKDSKLRKQYVDESIDFVGLNDFRKFFPKKLSGGLLRRLNIACGIAHKPDLIILDEPTVAVDPQSRNNILEGIKRLANDGATILYTSHYMEEVEQLCDKITIIDSGKNIITGNKYELINSVGLKSKLVVENVDLDTNHLSSIQSLHNDTTIVYKDKYMTISFHDNIVISKVVSYLESNKVSYQNINMESPSLNDVFLEITGKELRDHV